MRILFVHAYYQQPGGEDRSVDAEARLVARFGHDVEWFRFRNEAMAGWSAVRTATSVVWNREAYREARSIIRRFRPDVVHVQNVFPSLSPSVYWAAEAEGVPVVQKLSNHRLFCVNGLLYREGAVCTACLGKPVAWQGVRHGCFRSSRVMSAGVAASFALQRLFGTWDRRIAAWVALDDDGRERFTAAGLDPSKVHVKPDFVEVPPEPGSGDGGYALFAGRLSPEKGVDTLLAAWARLDRDVPLRVAGDGELAGILRDAAAGDRRIVPLGRLEPDALQRETARAALVVVPSRSFETFGRTAAEALVLGTPVIASRLGALRNVVTDGVDGAHFEAGDADGLARVVRSFFDDPVALRAMRERARERAARRYAPEADHERLVAIYESAVRTAGRGRA